MKSSGLYTALSVRFLRTWALLVFMLGAFFCLSITRAISTPAAARTSQNMSQQRADVQATATTSCGGGWSVVTSANVSSHYNALRGISAISTNDVWAVGYTGNLYAYPSPVTLTEHWNGTRWTIVPSPNLDGVGALLSVDAISTNDVWAVGYASYATTQMLILHWNGSVWGIVSAPPIAGGEARLYGVSAVGPNDVWAVGYDNSGPNNNSKTLTLHWNGSAWSVVPSPNIGMIPNELYGVTALQSNDVWAVGSLTLSTPITMHWNGAQWEMVTTPTTRFEDYTPNNLNAVDGAAGNDVWAVGAYRNSSYSYALAEHWDGVAWAITSLPLPNPVPNITSDSELYGVTAVSSNDVWAVGSIQVNNQNETVVLHWDGASWNLDPGANAQGTENRFYSADAVSGADVWAAGVQGNIFQQGLQTLVARNYNRCATPLPTSTSTPAAPTPTPTPCTAGTFSDVPSTNTFYPFVTCLVNRGIISGYSDCTFRPNNLVTRGQLAKIVSNAAGFTEDPDPQIFEDVAPDNTFYQWINRLTRRGYMSGYPCGGVGEPCTTGMPYFRPSANATRGQTSKIVSNAAGFTEEPTEQTFEDVPPTHTFYREIQRLASRNIMSGYPCGGPGEPCLSGKPYFRPQNNVTRGQSAKIVANTFFPGCNTP